MSVAEWSAVNTIEAAEPQSWANRSLFKSIVTLLLSLKKHGSVPGTSSRFILVFLKGANQQAARRLRLFFIRPMAFAEPNSGTIFLGVIWFLPQW